MKMSSKTFIPSQLKSDILSRDKFTCKKCSFKGLSEDLEVHKIKIENQEDLFVTLCSVCSHFIPEDNGVHRYIADKVDGTILETFRKSARSISRRTKKGMDEKAHDGNLVSRAPYGYKIDGKKLFPDTNTSFIVPEIFEDFLNQKNSLTQLAKKYGFSVNGLKKILTNQTYLGKVKFDGQIHQGTHQPLISSTTFNHVQNKLESLGIKPVSK